MKKIKLIAARRFDGEEGPVKRGDEIKVSADRAADLIRRGLAAEPGSDPLPMVAGASQEPLPVGDDAGEVRAPTADPEAETLRQKVEELTRQLGQVQAEYSNFQAAANQAGAEGTNERVRLEGELKAAQDRVAQLESQQGATEAEITVNWASLSSVVAPERMAALITEEEDRMLEPFKGKSGWYSFGEGEDLVKVQGREAAVEELARRVGQSAETVQQESNPDS